MFRDKDVSNSTRYRGFDKLINNWNRYLYPLVEISQTPGFAARLAGLLHKLPSKFAFYKRKPVWGKIVLAYLDEMAAKYPGPEAGDLP